jgi:hypothetical protein
MPGHRSSGTAQALGAVASDPDRVESPFLGFGVQAFLYSVTVAQMYPLVRAFAARRIEALGCYGLRASPQVSSR